MFPQSNRTITTPNATSKTGTAGAQDQQEHTSALNKRDGFTLEDQDTAAMEKHATHLSPSIVTQMRMYLEAGPQTHTFISGINIYLFGRLVSIETFRNVVVKIIMHLENPKDRQNFRRTDGRFDIVYNDYFGPCTALPVSLNAYLTPTLQIYERNMPATKLIRRRLKNEAGMLMSAGVTHQALMEDYEELKSEELSTEKFEQKSKGMVAINP